MPMIRNVLAAIGLFSVIIAASAGVFFFGGYFNVAATAREPGLMRWALIQVREASVRRYATEQPTLAMTSPDVIRTGARAYSERGCVSCHGAPGAVWNKFSEGLRPDPPDPTDIVKSRSAEELFFVIKNGINMTGMPSFASSSDQELWSIVAFLKQRPTVSSDQYKSWTGQGAAAPKS